MDWRIKIVSLKETPSECASRRSSDVAAYKRLRLFAVFAMMAVAALACRERPPTASLTRFKVKSNVCIVGCGCSVNDPICGGGEHPPAVAADSVAVFCEPHVLTRGDTVSCLIYIGSRSRFVVTSRMAYDPTQTVFAVSGGRDTVSNGHDSIYVAGDTARWRGPAVTSSRITIRVEWTDRLRITHAPSALDSFTVTPRALPEYAIVNAPKELRDSLKPGKMTAYPLHSFVDATGKAAVDINGKAIAATATYGLFEADSVFDKLNRHSLDYAETVQSGPNAQILWFRRLPPLFDSTLIWIHPALKGGGTLARARLWYRQQDGGTQLELFPHDSTILHDTITAPDRLVRHTCDASDVTHLQSLVEGHEGVGTAAPSHYSILMNAVATSGLKVGVESLFVQLFAPGYAIRLSDAVIDLVTPVITGLNATQHDFEQPQYDTIFGKKGSGARASDLGAINCRIRYDSASTATIVVRPSP